MTKKTALLALTGGRCTPDILALQCIHPELVVILTSEEGYRDEATFVKFANNLPQHKIQLPTVHVESYDLDKVKQACLDICTQYPQTEWDWTFSISSCPKILAFGAYEIAQQLEIPCVYIDSRHKKIISFIKGIGVSSESFFHMSVDDYMEIFQRTRDKTNYDEKYRAYVQAHSQIAKIMACSADTPLFSKYMRDKKAKEKVEIPDLFPATSPLLRELEHHGAIHTHVYTDGRIECQFTNAAMASFLGKGDWLEVYTWSEVEKAGFADDNQWGYTLQSTAKNELDTVFTYDAQLIFTECKTDENPFKKKKASYLDAMNSKAEMLGRTYTTKVFVTNASKTLDGYANFWEQAQLRQIVVVTAEDLPNIGEILKKQAIDPDFPRK
ncbi:hypothetical protein KDW_39780 [Dictyobacter vulcani]|uniref:Card1 endonuclease domain-containing protein n=1 Tax=Dictyobacter vulcani TaxID=2607529 RepID=A0A5J4KX86_9CHLR|nr:DUF1887 family CARF protein [Dictyobacter vulcani]GER89816.1 hypothetical protein KDW_39780 [Dictyobacter vulcani]